MNPDLIKRAVELAEGWKLIGEIVYPPVKNSNIAMHVLNPKQWMLDALAAQLVRQVDALDGISLDNKGGKFPELIIWDFRPGNNRMAASQRGPDRTMNTIKVSTEFLEAMNDE